MGRKKIQISRITDERNRQVTFNKRKFGVMKKAYELSVLCDCEIALIIFSSSNKLYQYASTDMDKVLLKYTEYNEPHESLTNKNIIEALTKKENKNGVMSPESPEQDTDYTLTPRTEAKYSKIDEDFQIMMQRNQQIAAGQRVTMSGSGGNYTLPVSVPIPGNYGDTSMLQTSPQLAHTNISPRPSSSETDSVYPSGSILEMSNGYPHSASPLGGSPSPGPSPGIGGHHHKSHHIGHKQHSPGSQSGRNSNLRVVIPTPMSAPGMSSNDDITNYGEHRQQSALNTPVVALQTPGIPSCSGFPSLGSFGAQDFSMTSSDVMGLTSWNHQSLSTVQHTRYLPHLAVSNSTPPPSTSPISVKVKSEPVSPPREHHNNLVSGGSGGGPGISGMNGGCGNNSGGGGNVGGNNDVTIVGSSGGIGIGLSGMGHNNHNSTSGLSITTMNNANSNISILSHQQQQQQQQHLIMNSRPSSTGGHLTPTSGTVTPTNVPSPGNDLHRHSSSLQDYDSPNNPNKRPRISEGWAT